MFIVASGGSSSSGRFDIGLRPYIDIEFIKVHCTEYTQAPNESTVCQGLPVELLQECGGRCMADSRYVGNFIPALFE